MSLYCASNLNTQNDLLMKNLMDFYNNHATLNKMMSIINGETKISSFKLFILGEGIEKKESDFAAEVAAMTS